MIDEFWIVIHREDEKDIRVNVERYDGKYIVNCTDITTGEMRQVLEIVDQIADLNNEQ